MTAQWVFIEPQDVWMFRDNKPFAAAANFVARSIFPPHPQTLYGMLRSYHLNSMGTNWHAYMAGKVSDPLAGSPTQLGRLWLQGIYVAQRSETGSIQPLFRAPLDLLHKHNELEDLDLYDVMTPTEQDFASNVPFTGWLPLKSSPGYKETEGWLTPEGFTSYLSGEHETFVPAFVKKSSDIFVEEGRVGLAIDYAKRAHREQMFYRAEFIRPCPDIGLLLCLNEAVFSETIGDSGFVELGGESRAGRFEVVDAPPLPETPHLHVGENGKKRFKLILLTSAYFEQGWQPIDWSPWIKGHLVSAVIGKPLSISGWDIAAGKAKPLRRYIPAGSVYYFEGDLMADAPALTEGANNAQMGFGQFTVGSW